MMIIMLSSADFFFKSIIFSSKIISGIPFESQTVWIQMSRRFVGPDVGQQTILRRQIKHTGSNSEQMLQLVHFISENSSCITGYLRNI